MAETIRRTSDLKEALFQADNQLFAAGMPPLSPEEMRAIAQRMRGPGPGMNPMEMVPQGMSRQQAVGSVFNQGPVGLNQAGSPLPPGSPGAMLQGQSFPTGGAMNPMQSMQGQPGGQGQFQTTMSFGPDQQLSSLILKRIRNRMRTTEV